MALSVPPQFRSARHVALRGDEHGRLTLNAVRRASWGGDLRGRSVRISLLRVRSFDAGVAEAVGRLVAEAGARDVQVEGVGQVADLFSAAAAQAAREFAQVMDQ